MPDYVGIAGAGCKTVLLAWLSVGTVEQGRRLFAEFPFLFLDCVLS
jgi:hypothetical protein